MVSEEPAGYRIETWFRIMYKICHLKFLELVINNNIINSINKEWKNNSQEKIVVVCNIMFPFPSTSNEIYTLTWAVVHILLYNVFLVQPLVHIFESSYYYVSYRTSDHTPWTSCTRDVRTSESPWPEISHVSRKLIYARGNYTVGTHTPEKCNTKTLRYF